MHLFPFPDLFSIPVARQPSRGYLTLFRALFLSGSVILSEKLERFCLEDVKRNTLENDLSVSAWLPKQSRYNSSTCPSFLLN